MTAMVPIDTLGYGSDNVPFSYAGVPNLMVESLGEHLYYHTPDDTIDTITEADLGAVASLMVAGLKPLVEGTEESYLSEKAAPAKAAPANASRRDRHMWER